MSMYRFYTKYPNLRIKNGVQYVIFINDEIYYGLGNPGEYYQAVIPDLNTSFGEINIYQKTQGEYEDGNNVKITLDTSNTLPENLSITIYKAKNLIDRDIYDPGNMSLYLGQFEGEASFEDFVETLPINPIEGNIILYRDISTWNSYENSYEEYIYYEGWYKVTFFGTVTNTSARVNPDPGEIVYSVEDNAYMISYNGTGWQECFEAIFVFLNFVEPRSEEIEGVDEE